ncbi:MAG TPA: hypothetical protein VNA04_05285 [Thermoanaerobaculia bacterium]|nr:hypothetical protein [Thermoanaerobaculia bacterium]
MRNRGRKAIQPVLRALSALLVSTLIFAAAATADDSGWTMTEVIPRGAALPGGGSLTEVGTVYSLKDGAYAFWAKSGDKHWGLYLANGAGVSRLLVERTDLKLDGVPDSVSVQYQPGGLYIPTEMVFSNDVLYLETRRGRGNPAVLAVTAGGLTKILARGDTAPYPEGAVVASTKPLAADGGRLLLHYSTEKPKPGNHWAIWDGTSSRHVLSAGDEVLPGTRVRALYGSRWYMTRAVPTLVGDHIVADLEVEGGSYPRAIFDIGPGGARKLLAVGEVLPDNAARKIQGFTSVAAAGPDRFLVQLDSVGEGFMSLEVSSFYLYDHGKLRRVMTWKELNAELGSLEHVTWSAHFLGDLTILQIHPRPKVEGGSFFAVQDHFYLVDLETTKKVEASGGCCGHKAARRLATPSGSEGLIGGTRVVGYRWLDAKAPERMQEPPAISTDKGEVSLGDVAAWLGTDKGVVVREGSLYLIERAAAGQPAAPATNVELYWQLY